MSRSKVSCICDADVKGEEKYKPFIDEAIDNFLECIGYYYNCGYLEELSLHVFFEEEKLDNE